MFKFILVGFSLLLLCATPVEAQRFYCGPRGICKCPCYFNFALANYDGIPYGYVDNINYPDMYALPRNRCFNYCVPCYRTPYDAQYFYECIRYTNGMHAANHSILREPCP